MEKDILSLRNIYRFLMVNDYPVYSTGALKEENRKGLTLTKFWQETLLYEFRSGYYGKMIWRTSGGRNRHISEMCNRSEVLKWYPQYTSELASAISEKALLQQISQFKTFLQERKCDVDVLEKKIEAAISMFYTQDVCFHEDIAEFFRRNMKEGKAELGRERDAKLFCVCWVLTFLTIHAMAGEEMNHTRMKALRQKEEFSLKALWNSQRENTDAGSRVVHFLTNQNNALCITPLPMMHFFGREMELFDLRELLEQGGYYMLSGMGGIGKTELLRQLLHLCVEQRLVDEVAVIQYEGSLKSSCANAFPNIQQMAGENTLNEVMARIRMQEGKRVLTLVDNMNNTLEEDPELKQLLTLPGTVILTSRLTGLEGFTTYEVKAPGREMGMLIFRDNYGKALSKEDKEELQELLKQDIWCHTLTLRLLGNTAKVKNWSVGVLKEKLEAKDSQIFKARENREINLVEMYRRMYDLSELSEGHVRFLRCFAALPYQNYTEEFIDRFLTGYFADRGQMQESLAYLQTYGWINGTKEGYTMHPVIKECVLYEPLKNEDILPFGKALEEYWWQKCGSKEKRMEDWLFYVQNVVAEDLHLESVWIEATNSLQEQLSGELGRVTIMALGIENCLCNETIISNSKKRITVPMPDEFQVENAIYSVQYEYREKADYYRSLWKNRKELGMSDWQQKLYGLELGQALIKYNEPQEALQVLEEPSREGNLGWCELWLVIIRSEAYTSQVKLVEAYQCLQPMIERMEEGNIPDGILKFTLLFQQVKTCAELRKYEEVKDALSKLEVLVEKNDSIYMKYRLAYAKGVPWRNMGNLQKACENQLEAVRLIKLLDEKSSEYAINCADLALLLCKCGRIEEAEKYYLEGMPILEQNAIYAFMTSRAWVRCRLRRGQM